MFNIWSKVAFVMTYWRQVAIVEMLTSETKCPFFPFFTKLCVACQIQLAWDSQSVYVDLFNVLYVWTIFGFKVWCKSLKTKLMRAANLTLIRLCDTSYDSAFLVISVFFPFQNLIYRFVFCRCRHSNKEQEFKNAKKVKPRRTGMKNAKQSRYSSLAFPHPWI